MSKIKSFLKTPLGIVTIVVAGVIVVIAYASRLPAIVRKTASKLPGADQTSTAAA